MLWAIVVDGIVCFPWGIPHFDQMDHVSQSGMFVGRTLRLLQEKPMKTYRPQQFFAFSTYLILLNAIQQRIVVGRVFVPPFRQIKRDPWVMEGDMDSACLFCSEGVGVILA